MKYTNEQAIEAIKARMSGTFDNPELMKLGLLSPNPLSDIKLILRSIDKNSEPSPIIQKLFVNMDWELLRKQKKTLVSLALDDMRITHAEAQSIDGILGILDAIMDLAVDELGMTSMQVFGKNYPSLKSIEK